MQKILSIIKLLTFLLFVSCSKEDTPQPTTPPLSEKDFSPLTAIMQSNLSAFNGNAGLLLMSKDGTILYKQYFGSYNDNTYIPIASGSKLPSMVTIMALVDKGLVNLNDKVSLFYPAEFAATDRKDITVRQLMSHTSGFAGGSQWISTDLVNLQEAVKGIGQGGVIGTNNVPAASMPYAPNGSKFGYGGVSMHVAGGIAEKVTGKTWDVIFKEQVADKLAMPNTNYVALGNTTNYRIAGGAGTRMMEFANLLLMLLNDGKFNGVQILSKNAIDEMLKDQTNGMPIAFTPYEGDPLRQNFRYGLGCWVEEVTNGVPTAFGSQGAFGFSPWIDKKRNVIGILFVQRTLGAVNTQPTAETAPYTLIRKKINEIIDAP
ncbi:serine hydrolase domain-containing protein [Thermoflexibacter ruber]|uniref:CubicO group peptidase, beta-lactamase class C family n=1 Tax=Thermoflexibacter ruber TaxID=1003 RepID=A0A1I2J4L2_9BACT|nr:serine hydrolase domain-containing protein [Thermoflexibacter ruber]SFF49474.1 CubicO group peptidase, beta-lactamase class C family [Thermoflexibacter ruber]